MKRQEKIAEYFYWANFDWEKEGKDPEDVLELMDNVWLNLTEQERNQVRWEGLRMTISDEQKKEFKDRLEKICQ